ncbi:hypothetical protein L6R50_11935 [Myxococcota bacterium]|nr:hypothetical protein [Myxococcota bacterium]
MSGPPDPVHEAAGLLERARRAGLPAPVVALLAQRGGTDPEVRGAVARWLDDVEAEQAAARRLPELLATLEIPEVPPPPEGATGHPDALRAIRTLEVRAAAGAALGSPHPGDGISLAERARSRLREERLGDAEDPGRARVREVIAGIGGQAGIPVLLDEEKDALLAAQDPDEALEVLGRARLRIAAFGREARAWVKERTGGRADEGG